MLNKWKDRLSYQDCRHKSCGDVSIIVLPKSSMDKRCRSLAERRRWKILLMRFAVTAVKMTLGNVLEEC